MKRLMKIVLFAALPIMLFFVACQKEEQGVLDPVTKVENNSSFANMDRIFKNNNVTTNELDFDENHIGEQCGNSITFRFAGITKNSASFYTNYCGLGDDICSNFIDANELIINNLSDLNSSPQLLVKQVDINGFPSTAIVNKYHSLWYYVLFNRDPRTPGATILIDRLTGPTSQHAFSLDPTVTNHLNVIQCGLGFWFVQIPKKAACPELGKVTICDEEHEHPNVDPQ
jgi:hypothetical protein